MTGSGLFCPCARAASTPALAESTPEFMLNVPPTHRVNPWQTMWLLARKRLQDVRCMIPQASVYGPLQQPKAEFCYRGNGLRICASSKLSFDRNNYSGGLFITNRPGECPF